MNSFTSIFKFFSSLSTAKWVALSGFIIAAGTLVDNASKLFGVVSPTLSFVGSVPSIIFGEDICSTEHPKQLIHAETEGFDIYICSSINSNLPKEYHGIEKGENGQKIILKDGKNGASIYQKNDGFVVINRGNGENYEYHLFPENLNILKSSSVIFSDSVKKYEISDK
jgi:hypothetical protein